MNDPFLLFGAGLLAGAMNAVAGGGSFVTLPALMFSGVPSVIANASSTAALFPAGFASAWAFREDYRPFPHVSLPTLLATSLFGGVVGALLLLSTPSSRFDALLPWLLLIAALVFAFGEQLGQILHRERIANRAAMLVVQLALGIYAGYFGGGAGLMMLAAWGLLGLTDVKALNPTRVFLVSSANGIAVLCFALSNAIWWPQALLMLVAATLGGYVAARLARRLDARRARRLIVVFNFAITAAFFWRTYA